MLEALGDLERDIAGELINLGLGVAADGLSQMLGEEIDLATPVVDCVPWQRLARSVGIDPHQAYRGVQQHVSGAIDGEALLLFPGGQGERLVSEFLHARLGRAPSSKMIEEALVEVGNIILGATLSSFSDGLSLDMEFALPEPFVWGPRLRRARTEGDEGYLIVISLEFQVRARNVKGGVCLVLDLESGERLAEAIGRSVRSLGC